MRSRVSLASSSIKIPFESAEANYSATLIIMSKKTFLSLLGLMLGCGVLALAVFVIGSRPVDKAEKPIWKIKANLSTASHFSFTADGKTILSHGNIGLQKLESQTGKPLPAAAPLGNNRTNYFSAISANHKIAVISRNGKLRIVNRQVWSKWKTKRSSNGEITVVPKEKPVKVAVKDSLTSQRMMDVWDFKTFKQLFSVPIPDDVLDGAKWSVHKILLSSDGTRLFLSVEYPDYPAKVYRSKNQLWDTRRGAMLWQNRSTRNLDPPDRSYTFFDPQNRLCYASAPAVQSEIRPPFPIYSSGLDIVDFQTKKVINQFESAKTLPERNLYSFWQAVTFSPDGRLVAALFKTSDGYAEDGWDSTIVCWDKKTRRVQWTFRKNKILPKVLQFALDSNSLAVGAGNFESMGNSNLKGALFLLDCNTGQQTQHWSEETWQDRLNQNWYHKPIYFRRYLRRYFPPKRAGFLAGDSGEVSTLSFSPDGKTLAAGYADGSIKLWKVPR